MGRGTHLSGTLVILNPHAGSGKAARLWTTLEPLLWERLGHLIVAITQHPNDVAPHLEHAYAVGVRRTIAIGGDGTNHALVNAIIALNARHADDDPMVYGNIPIGTGRDWARGLNIPYRDPRAAADWIATAQPQSVDVGLLTHDKGCEYFLNIATAGIGGNVASRVNQTTRRRPWTFLAATVAALLEYQPRPIHVALDGASWFTGKAYVTAIANGTTLGHGMKIAPDARVGDGLFDVILIPAMPRLKILAALRRVYDGSHLAVPGVQFQRAAQVEITSTAGSVDLEFDGEVGNGSRLTFEVRPGLIQLLL
jgi:YegS/Rv2252/BmrU family lipid kinase